MKKKYLLDRIAIMLGGRAAEKIQFDDFSTGAADDAPSIFGVTVENRKHTNLRSLWARIGFMVMARHYCV